MTDCGPGRRQERIASSRSVVGLILYLSAIPPHTPAMIRCFLERYIASTSVEFSTPKIVPLIVGGKSNHDDLDHESASDIAIMNLMVLPRK
jgi:hypothetical protein